MTQKSVLGIAMVLALGASASLAIAQDGKVLEAIADLSHRDGELGQRRAQLVDLFLGVGINYTLKSESGDVPK